MGMQSKTHSVEPVIVPPDGGWGWVVLIGSFVAYFIADGWAYSFGVIFPDLLQEFEEGRGKTALIGALLYGIPLLGSPVVCALTSAYGCRPVAVMGGVISGIAFSISCLANSFNYLVVTSGVFASVGLAMIYIPSIIIVTYYFEKRRGVATGLALVGSGLGAVAFPLLMEYLINEFGWRYSMLLLGGIFFQVMPAGALFRPPPVEYPSLKSSSQNLDDMVEPATNKSNSEQPVFHEANEREVMLSTSTPHHSSENSQPEGGSVGTCDAPELMSSCDSSGIEVDKEYAEHCQTNISDSEQHHIFLEEDKKTSNCCTRFCQEMKMLGSKMFDRSLVSSRTYVAFSAATFILYLFVGMPYVYLMDKANLVGIDETRAAFLFSIIGIGRTVGQIVLGFVGDLEKVNTVCLYGISITIVGVATLLVPISAIYPALCAYSVVFGFFISVTYTLQMMCLIEMVGLQKATNAFGLYQLVQGVATLLGTPIAGWLYEATNSYDSSFYVAGALITFSGLVVIPLPWVFRPVNARDEEN